MAFQVRRGWAVFQVGVIGLIVGIGLAGCGKKATPPGVEGGDAPQGSEASEAGTTTGPEARLRQTFAEATLPDPPEDQVLPYVTIAGKSVGKIYEDTVKMWDQVQFLTPKGKHLTYRATLETELGEIDITLLPNLAPNHVRSFIALAKVGYYDGLVFERAVRQQEDKPDNTVELVEAGCPLGTGNPGVGSIGYWLKPEFSEDRKHEEGTVGACLLGETPDTAACRFYITLSKAPVMDGNRTIFGKVSRGLDVVRRISTQPLLNAPDFPDGSRPEHPIMIRKVTIKAKEVE